jgi:hypothetical protein
MKSLNPVTKQVYEIVKNPEGGSLFKTPADVNLYSVASAFKLRNSFYWTSNDTLKVLENAIDNEKDFEYKAGLALFLSKFLGIRLSPVILLSRLSKGLFTQYDKEKLAKVTLDVMDRPDKIANSIAYAQYAYGNGKELPPYFKRALKHAFERFDAYTLRKFKLRRRKVKTADVIKLLHPKPRNKVMSNLYKALIENSKEATIEKGTVITEVLSDSKLSEKEKTLWVTSNLSKLPLNSLIRNLASIEDTEENLRIIRARLLNAMRVENGYPIVKVFNPFDLLNLLDSKISDRKLYIILDVITAFVNAIDLGIEGKKIKFLVDISGSMRGESIANAKKYFMLLVPMLKGKNKLSFSSFNTHLYSLDNVIGNNKNDVYSIFNYFNQVFTLSGGTSLLDSIKKVIDTEHPDLVVVFSDEITWADADVVSPKLNFGVPIIAVNPAPNSSGTAFNPKNKIVRLSSIDAKILYFIPALTDFSAFKSWIKSLIRK